MAAPRAPRATPRTTPRVEASQIAIPCPSHIWLLGGITQCSLPLNHEGLHEVTLRWGME